MILMIAIVLAVPFAFVQMTDSEDSLFLGLLVFGELLIATSGLAHTIAAIGALMQSLGIAGLVWSSLRPRRGMASTLRAFNSPLSRAALVGVSVILALQNAWRIDDLRALPSQMFDVVNPWALCLAGVIFATVSSRNANTVERAADGQFPVLVSVAALGFLGILAGVRFGVIPGNTQKAVEGVGGIGFYSFSTNDTAILGLALFIWSAHYAIARHSVRFATLAILLAGGIVATQSRAVLLLLIIVVLLFIAFASIGRTARIMLAMPALIVLAGLLVQVITSRSGTETINAARSLSALPGSGRPLIWLSFIDAFLEQAAVAPWAWLVGVGPSGLVDLYNATPLFSVGLTLPTFAFYPTHSDVLTLFISGGVCAFVLAGYAAIGLLSRAWRSAVRFSALSSWTAFFGFAAIDMPSARPSVVALLAYSILSSRYQLSSVPRIQNDQLLSEHTTLTVDAASAEDAVQ